MRPTACERRGALALLPARPRHRPVTLRSGTDSDARCREPHALPRLPARKLQARRLGHLRPDGRYRRCPLRPSGRDHQPKRVLARELHRSRDLGGDRRPRHARGRDPWRDAGEFCQDGLDRNIAGSVAVRARRTVHPGHALSAAWHSRLAPRREAPDAPALPAALTPAESAAREVAS